MSNGRNDAASEIEQEAIRLRFHHQNPDLPADAEPSTEDFERLLGEVRERQSLIEQEALRMLNQKLRTPGGRSGLASRHTVGVFQYLALPAIVVLGCIAVAMLIIALFK